MFLYFIAVFTDLICEKLVERDDGEMEIVYKEKKPSTERKTV